MRLVIEREGGFDIIEDSDAIRSIEVMSYGVKVVLAGGGGEWAQEFPVTAHEAACRLSAAIAVKCGVLVEPLAEQPEIDGEEAMGAASAALVRNHTRPWKSSEWVDGEPRKGGLWYVVSRGGTFGCVAWDGNRFRDWHSETVVMGGDVAHLPTPLPFRR